VRRRHFDVRIDTDFAGVIGQCAAKTADRTSTWINTRIRSLYIQLHRMGCCHSVECWQDGRLVGGLYGVRIGAIFFGESMFSRVTDASKVALVHLVARLNFGGFKLLDAQFVNPHLETLGAIKMPKARYHEVMEPLLSIDADFHAFKGDDDPEWVLAWASHGQSKGSSSPI
jgi:leucyl/phenylalanyl-tRNA--protein transferase